MQTRSFNIFTGESSYTEGSARLLARFEKLRQEFKDLRGLYKIIFSFLIMNLGKCWQNLLFEHCNVVLFSVHI